MRTFVTTLALALIVAPAAPAQWFGWSISNSSVDFLSNSGAIAPGPNMFAGNLYLWMVCTTAAGMASAEFDVVETTGTPGAAPTGFTPLNGFLNAGGISNLLLAVGGCPVTGRVAGAFNVGADQFIPDIELCIVPSAANGLNVSVRCGDLAIIPNRTIGFRKSGIPACNNFAFCEYTSVRSESWGRIKGIYR